jgi:hypothetical protein
LSYITLHFYFLSIFPASLFCRFLIHLVLGHSNSKINLYDFQQCLWLVILRRTGKWCSFHHLLLKKLVIFLTELATAEPKKLHIHNMKCEILSCNSRFETIKVSAIYGKISLLLEFFQAHNNPKKSDSIIAFPCCMSREKMKKLLKLCCFFADFRRKSPFLLCNLYFSFDNNGFLAPIYPKEIHP